jgi:hypothetical protein
MRTTERTCESGALLKKRMKRRSSYFLSVGEKK